MTDQLSAWPTFHYNSDYSADYFHFSDYQQPQQSVQVLPDRTLEQENKCPENEQEFEWMNKRRGGKATDKKPTTFTKHQSIELEKEFLVKNYLVPAKKEELSMRLGLTTIQVKTWFQNRRMKEKRSKKSVESGRNSSSSP
uniref:Homeobox domain-containing protein n=1 Tax=Caenorhabditis japonica TaxID=281687 RepID=A0A8R1I4A5_CAEJA